MNKNKALTLFEIILALAIAGIIVVVLASEFNLGLKVYESARYNTTAQAQDIMETLSQDLSSAYLFSGDLSGLTFQGSADGLSFVTFMRLGHDVTELRGYALKKVVFSLEPGADGALVIIYKQYSLPLSDETERVIVRKLSSLVKSVRFQYHDGRQWQAAWNSSQSLPQAVKVVLMLYRQPGFRLSETFSTIIEIPCAG